jgi:hypothetical protein
MASNSSARDGLCMASNSSARDGLCMASNSSPEARKQATR